MLFRAPECHTFSRNRPRSSDGGQNAAEAASEIQRLLTQVLAGDSGCRTVATSRGMDSATHSRQSCNPLFILAGAKESQVRNRQVSYGGCARYGELRIDNPPVVDTSGVLGIRGATDQKGLGSGRVITYKAD